MYFLCTCVQISRIHENDLGQYGSYLPSHPSFWREVVVSSVAHPRVDVMFLLYNDVRTERVSTRREAHMNSSMFFVRLI